MESDNNFGEFLRNLRGSLSLREASKITGLSYTYIRDLEKGHDRRNNPIRPTLHTLKCIANGYKVSLDEILRKASDSGEIESATNKQDSETESSVSYQTSFAALKAWRDALARGEATDIPADRIPHIVDNLDKEIMLIERQRMKQKNADHD